MPVFIYGLSDPVTNAIRYVGKTYDIDKRYREHINCVHHHLPKNRWIRKLQRKGLAPIISVLQISDTENWVADEIEWIRFGRTVGWSLLNLTTGGEHAYTPELLIGARFKQLTITGYVFGTNSIAYCICSCGSKITASVKRLKNGQKRSCGCHRRQIKDDLSGRSFGDLVVTKLSSKRNSGHTTYYECRCVCGGEVTVSRSNLISKHTRSCGCHPRGKAARKLRMEITHVQD